MYGGLHAPGELPSPTALLELARDFSPRVEALAPTPVLLDLSGLGRTWSTPEALGRALRDAGRARALETRVALAWSRIAALTLARGREGVTVVPPGGEAEALAPLPLSLLELSPELHDLLRRWGLRRLGDLARLPATGLAERLGVDGPRLRRLARGEDDAPLVPAPPPQEFACRLELDWPVDGLEPLSFLLARVLETLCGELGRRGRSAAELLLELDLVDTTQHRRRLRPALPSADPRTWRTLLLLDLEAHPPRDAVRVIGVRAEPTPARRVQLSLLDPAQPDPEKLAETLARLVEWTAEGRAGAPLLLDSHRPGAFLLGSFAPGAPPPRALPRGGVLALRPFRPPLAARVELRNEAPEFVSAAGIRGRVTDRAGPWHASGDWWDAGWSRAEWDVALSGGELYRIFRDQLGGGWFVAGELD